jgi:uncharacterized protein YbcV (DUF1398 family)
MEDAHGRAQEVCRQSLSRRRRGQHYDLAANRPNVDAAVDFRRALATYYLPDGESVELPVHKIDVPVTPTFDAVLIQAAIKEAQLLVPGSTYRGFCNTVASADCAGYIVSFSGRALYIGQTADTYVEHFSD